MTHVRGKGWHESIDVEALMVPPENCPDDERVPEIVDSSPFSVNIGSAKEVCECVMYVVVDEFRSDE